MTEVLKYTVALHKVVKQLKDVSHGQNVYNSTKLYAFGNYFSLSPLGASCYIVLTLATYIIYCMVYVKWTFH